MVVVVVGAEVGGGVEEAGVEVWAVGAEFGACLGEAPVSTMD